MYAKWLLILLEWDEIFLAFVKSVYLLQLLVVRICACFHFIIESSWFCNGTFVWDNSQCCLE